MSDAAPKPKVSVTSDEEEAPAPGSEATFNNRVVAGLIDSLVGVALYIVVIVIMPAKLHILGNLVYLAYTLTKDCLPFLGGQSVGKKAMRMQAVLNDGTSLAGNWQAGILRNAFMLISPVELFILWSKNEKGAPLRRLGDDYAKTKVIMVAETPDPAPPSKPTDTPPPSDPTV